MSLRATPSSGQAPLGRRGASAVVGLVAACLGGCAASGTSVPTPPGPPGQRTPSDVQRAAANAQRGLELRAAGRPAEALRAFQLALEADPQRYDLHYQRGTCYYALGEYEEELAEYRKCLALNPNYVRCLRNLGHALFVLDRLEEARGAYERCLAAQPQDPLVVFNLAQVEADLGNLGRAETLWRQYLVAARDLGSDAGRREEARQRLRELERRGPDSSANPAHDANPGD